MTNPQAPQPAPRAPGPWRVVRMSRPQVRGNFFVVRDLLVDESNSHYEQLCDSNGVVEQFHTEGEALAAIAKAAGGAA